MNKQAVVSVSGGTYHENGRRTVEVQCACGLVHTLDWPRNRKTIGNVGLPCKDTEDTTVFVEVPVWAETRIGSYKHSLGRK